MEREINLLSDSDLDAVVGGMRNTGVSQKETVVRGGGPTTGQLAYGAVGGAILGAGIGAGIGGPAGALIGADAGAIFGAGFLSWL